MLVFIPVAISEVKLGLQEIILSKVFKKTVVLGFKSCSLIPQAMLLLITLYCHQPSEERKLIP